MGVDLEHAIDVLSGRYSIRDEDFIAYYLCKRGRNPFEVLVAVVLSQNTRDKLALRAFNNLKRLLGELTPDKLLTQDPRIIEGSIRVAGLYRRKYATLVALSRKLVGLKSLNGLLTMPSGHLKELLLSVDGVGRKTVDVFLLMCRGEPVFPIDTHIKRILIRLGIADEDHGYIKIQSKVHELLPPSYYLKAHLTLIEHGRRVCRARRPLCGECAIKDLCPRIGLVRQSA